MQASFLDSQSNPWDHLQRFLQNRLVRRVSQPLKASSSNLLRLFNMEQCNDIDGWKQNNSGTSLEASKTPHQASLLSTSDLERNCMNFFVGSNWIESSGMRMSEI